MLAKGQLAVLGSLIARRAGRSRKLALQHRVPDSAPSWPLSEGEVHCFYWFIQGCIMIPETRRQLRSSWGFCERHCWAHLAVETAFRGRFLLGPAIIYEDLLGNAIDAFLIRGALLRSRLSRRLASKAPCLMCEMNAYGAGPGAALPGVIRRGRRIDELCAFATETKAHWKTRICGVCDGSGTAVRCRVHLLQDLANGRTADIMQCRDELSELYRLLTDYRCSLTWGHEAVDNLEASAAIIGAVGWLGGWRPLLVALAGTPNAAIG